MRCKSFQSFIILQSQANISFGSKRCGRAYFPQHFLAKCKSLFPFMVVLASLTAMEGASFALDIFQALWGSFQS